MSDTLRRTRLLGWSLIGLVGGGATVASLLIAALGLFIADIFVLKKKPAEISYLTILRLKGTATAGGEASYIYEVKNADGISSDAHLPWAASPGDRVRVKSGRTRIFHFSVPLEGPTLCRGNEPCE